jgi:hypothetical protein
MLLLLHTLRRLAMTVGLQSSPVSSIRQRLVCGVFRELLMINAVSLVLRQMPLGCQVAQP